MAVPKKRTSYSKTRKSYFKTHNFVFYDRVTSFNLLDMSNKLKKDIIIKYSIKNNKIK